MKKPLKYGLIAGITVLLIAGAWVHSGYDSGRMPTLPTPPGVVVPAGMRYVGGDEFVEFDRQKPARFKPMNEPADIADATCEIQGGNLHLEPSWSGTNKRTHVGIKYVDALKLGNPLRIEIRAKTHVSEHTNAFAKSKTRYENWTQCLSGATLVGDSFHSYTPTSPAGGTYVHLFENEYDRTTAGVYENVGNVHVSPDEEFHTYIVTWNAGKIRWTRDAVALKAEFDTRPPLISPRWLNRLTFLSESTRDQLLEWKGSSQDKSGELNLGYGEFDRPSDLNDVGFIEIDYVRIFQE